MKKHFLLFFGLALCLASCRDNASDSIIGTWKADKVNVQFDERRNTPEVVKQIGEMEKQNSIVISADSILVFKSLDGESKGRLSLAEDGRMFVDGAQFGQWKEGTIVTQSDSPLGMVVVSYCKK
ncbi:MAG: hypothetical protein IJ622_04980 [Bacteroidales bacterium]|nr:hypothetical protein [Bacteroidales bacterium]